MQSSETRPGAAHGPHPGPHTQVPPAHESGADEVRLVDLFAPGESATELPALAHGKVGARRRHAALGENVPAPPPFFVRALVGGSKALLMLVLVWGLFFNFSEVRGGSMRPGIENGDRILVDHVSYMFSGVERGDIVVLRYPLDPSVDYVKRVVGLPGDRVEIFRGQVWINGSRLDEDYVAAENIDPWAVTNTVVEPGHYFVLGDNRLRSSDSREFGQVAEAYLRGKVRACLWPARRVGLIQ